MIPHFWKVQHKLIDLVVSLVSFFNNKNGYNAFSAVVLDVFASLTLSHSKLAAHYACNLFTLSRDSRS